jgi:prepilin-type N-terminal cleavage/methylation domain-containing protein
MRVLAQNNFQIVADSRGFTLVELIMVVVLISILAVSVVPKFVDTSAISLQGGAAMVLADIRYTQELAMSTHHPGTGHEHPLAQNHNVYHQRYLLHGELADHEPSLQGVNFQWGNLYLQFLGGAHCWRGKFCANHNSRRQHEDNHRGELYGEGE